MRSTLPELLDCIAKRPQMFASPVSFHVIQDYLRGLRSGLCFAGIKYTKYEYLSAAKLRGWDPRGAIGIERDFVRHKLSDDEMVRELIAVETDAYMRALARLEKKRQGASRGDDDSS